MPTGSSLLAAEHPEPNPVVIGEDDVIAILKQARNDGGLSQVFERAQNAVYACWASIGAQNADGVVDDRLLELVIGDACRTRWEKPRLRDLPTAKPLPHG